MAREYSIDLSKVKGTGAGGRITKQDLEGYIARQQHRAGSAPAARRRRASRAQAASAARGCAAASASGTTCRHCPPPDRPRPASSR